MDRTEISSCRRICSVAFPGIATENPKGAMDSAASAAHVDSLWTSLRADHNLSTIAWKTLRKLRVFHCRLDNRFAVTHTDHNAATTRALKFNS